MFKRRDSYYKHASPWLLFTLAVYAIAFVYLFTENFIFSQTPELLSFRSVDDQWFQAYIREIHNGNKWYGLNHYNYGWIFWFPLAVVMYPFYLLSIHSDIYMPLLVLPRQISLMFVMGTAFVLYKIAGRYTQDKFLIAIILLLYLSYPATGYFSLRFGTIGQNMFFTALTYYLAIICKKSDKKSIFIVAFSFAVAVATKITALLLGPLIFLILAEKFNWKINKKNIITGLKFLGIFTLSFLYLAQINIPIFISNIKVLLLATSLETPSELLLRGVATYTLHPITFVIVLTGLLAIYLPIRNKQTRMPKDFLFIFLTLTASAAYLVFTVKSGSWYVCYYFAVVSFLLPLGVLYLDRFKVQTKYALGLGMVFLNVILNFNNIIGFEKNWEKITWNIYYMKPKDELIVNKISSQDNILKIINNSSCSLKQLNIIRDYFSIAVYSPLRTNILVKESIVVEDWPNALKRQHNVEHWDILGFDKRTVGFLSEHGVIAYLKNWAPPAVARFKKDRIFVQNFLKHKSINGCRYKILWEDKNLVYFVEEALYKSCFANSLDSIRW